MAAPLDVRSTDEEIVAAVRPGRGETFGLLFERHAPGLIRYLASQNVDPALAEDLAQDAFLDASCCLDQLPLGRHFAPWLFRIAQHRLHRAWRRERIILFRPFDDPSAQVESRSSPADQVDELAAMCAERQII